MDANMINCGETSEQIFKAGFDTTDISVDKWELLLDEMNIAKGVIVEKYREGTDVPLRYWLWAGSDGFVVTWCNPITGKHLCSVVTEQQIGTLSYVGIEGTKEFVDKVYNYIKEHASFYEDEEYGSRKFI
jgi:hypothetical protein